MKRTLSAAVMFASLAIASHSAAGHPRHGNRPVKLDNLMRAQLARVANTEVIVSRVTLRPNVVLPTHWHPGEEFAYVLKGSITLFQRGKRTVNWRAGQVIRVPLKQVHSARAGKRGATVLVFRVHESGKPERILVK